MFFLPLPPISLPKWRRVFRCCLFCISNAPSPCRLSRLHRCSPLVGRLLLRNGCSCRGAPRVCVVKLCDIFSNCLAIFGVAPKESDAETFVRFLVSSETPPQIAKAARDRPASGEAKSIALANLSISLGVSPHSPYIYPGLLIKPHLL